MGNVLENRDLRKRIAWMTWHSKEGHIPSAFSIIDIIVELYENFLSLDFMNLKSATRDYFILSKGHGCAALYAYFEKRGILREQDLLDKNKKNGILATHPDKNKVPGVEASTGSLGNGIGFALGIALGLKTDGLKNRVITLVGDAECNEGTVWECALLAPHLKLDNFVVIIDNNQSSNPTLPVPDFKSKFEAFGWQTFEISGHSANEIRQSFSEIINSSNNGQPKCIVANTVKGKGFREMEQNFGRWHSKVPNEEELNEILLGIENYD
jgi:transketolase